MVKANPRRENEQVTSGNPCQPEIISPARKPTLILIHGFRGAPAGLNGIAEGLRAAGYEVLLPAVPPFAGAPTLPEYTPDSYAAYMANYIREHQLERPVLIGHSMGSLVAAATASKYPGLVNRKLILLGPISARASKLFSAAAPLQGLVSRNVVDYITTRFLFIPHDHQFFKQVLTLTHECSGDCPPPRRDAAKVTKFSAHTAISDFSLTNDILFLTGKKDRLIPIRHTKPLVEKYQATAIFLEGTGHLHNYEKPDETVAAIVDFLESPKSLEPLPPL